MSNQETSFLLMEAKLHPNPEPILTSRLANALDPVEKVFVKRVKFAEHVHQRCIVKRFDLIQIGAHCLTLVRF